jgi:CheY-like chemotaxis protein
MPPHEAEKKPIKKERPKPRPKERVVELLLEEDEPTILIAKKNPLEAQILSKVLANLGYRIEIVQKMRSLEGMIRNSTYDLLLIDRELESPNIDILKKRHKNMNIIRLSLTKSTDKNHNSEIRDEIVGIMKRDKLKEIVEKYRSL